MSRGRGQGRGRGKGGKKKDEEEKKKIYQVYTTTPDDISFDDKQKYKEFVDDQTTNFVGLVMPFKTDKYIRESNGVLLSTQGYDSNKERVQTQGNMQNELLNLRQEKIILQDEMTKNSEKVKLESQNFDEKILKNRNIDQTLLEQLAKQMDDIQSERKIEKRERDSLNQDNTNLRQVVTSLNDKITSLNDKITSLDQDNTYLKQEVKNLNDRVSILEFEKAILTIYDISNYLIPIPEMSQKNRIHFESIDKKRTSGIKKT